jgi:hypothetical protein
MSAIQALQINTLFDPIVVDTGLKKSSMDVPGVMHERLHAFRASSGNQVQFTDTGGVQ